MFGKIRKLYFVGIGGSGMSGIAEILHNLGFEISGSDQTASDLTRYLAERGLRIHEGHDAAHLGDAEVVVISSAVGEANPEVVEARRRGIPVIKRAEMLGELMRLKYSIGVAGTHGKTTTTSMIGRILQSGGLKPTIIVGGIVAELGTGASLGEGEYLVAEADEFDRSFLAMFPTMAVVTNLEADHLDCYRGLDDLGHAFLTYMNRVPFFGSVVLSADNAQLMQMRDRLARPYVTFGFSVEADYRAVEVRLEPGRLVFSLYRRGQYLGDILLRVPGRHNVANA
nr:Mur ligase domain-containing protein [candidate division Zixibacteria bacterium]